MKLENNFRKAGGEFREFALKDLFEITGTKSLDEGKLDFVENGINFVGRVKHGIKGKIEPQPFEPNEPNTITASVIGYKYATFQKDPYYCSQNINKLIPKFRINPHIALYFVTHIQKYLSGFGEQYSGYKLVELQNHKILLPAKKDGSLALDYMEAYIKTIELEKSMAIEAYLESIGLKNYELSEEEKEALDLLSRARNGGGS